MAYPASSEAARTVVRAGTTLDLGDHRVEILASPLETGDRYRLRIVADPGGGPGIEGDGPHLHPVLVETFRCSSGAMRARLGDDLRSLAPGESIDVPAGTVHGFVNSGSAPLVVESEVVFPASGYRPDIDLLAFAAHYVRMSSEAREGEPSLLQLAVLTDAYREAMRPPGIAGMLLGPLAAVGRLRGYRVDRPRA